ncbi:MAG: NUDIX domain-containing protein [Pseudomonadota bacterium]
MKKALYRVAARTVLHPWFRLTRGLTLGTRVLVRNRRGEILLVRHTYAPGWLFPGGGVERDEVAEQAARREVHEEAGIELTGPLSVFGLYSNSEHFPGDHVVLYTAEADAEPVRAAQLEIAECGFFAADQLPDGTTGGTRRRVREVLDGLPADAVW